MQLKLKVYLVIISVLQCLCLCMILMGVTGGFDTAPVYTDTDKDVMVKSGDEAHHNGSAGETDSLTASTEQIPEKIVLLVIDALRLDFVTEDNFPFLMGTLGKYQSTSVLKFDVKVDSPTVTLPRVKTLVTGKSPVYMDVLRNFQTADTLKSNAGINQPNLIHILRKELPDLNICFFGDETWLRLFPPEDDKYSPYFKKWEGVTSFYVKDFYEVDSNVTRHLEDIDECNFLILHYLGLDHIGHVYGPKRTDLLQGKLREMDRVIQHLHSHLSNFKTKVSKNLMIITGDHGMANVGGHGGSSYEEVFTPLIAVTTGGVPHHHSKLETAQIKQIDIAPTLSAIWNVAIPQESRGQLILDLLELFKSTDSLAYSYQKNCRHLLNVLGNSRKAATYKLWWTEISKMEKPLAIKKYIELEQELATTLQNIKQQNSDFLSNFVVSMVLLICLQVYLFSCLKRIVGKYARYGVAVMFIPPVLTYFSSSFIEEEHYLRYYLYPSLLLVVTFWSQRCQLGNLSAVLKIMLLHRFGMMLNQTGDKWSNLPDVNDFILEHRLQWLSLTIAVILIYAFSQKTVTCSRTFKAALLSIYVCKLIVGYTDESYRGQLHWLLTDGKLQKQTFCVVFFHFTHQIYKLNVRQAVLSAAFMFLICLQRSHNVIVLSLVFAQANILYSLMDQPQDETAKIEKGRKGTYRINSLLSRIILIWFAHASFFYQGNSNSLATVDVNAGYIAIESYSSNFLIGSFILLHTFSSPIITYLSLGKVDCPQKPITNGSTHLPNHIQNRVRAKSEKSTKLPEFLPLLLVMSNGAECIIYACSLMMFQNHLFIWSVFVPKLLYLISQTVVCAIICCFYIFLL